MLKRHYVDCPFGQLHVTTDEAADRDAPPLILMNSRVRSLLPVLPYLRGAYRPIIVDIPGMALSSPPPPGTTMPDVASCLLALVDTWSIERAHLFGMHTGHKIGAAFAATCPDRVARFVMMGKTHSLVVPIDARNAAMQGYIARRPPDVLLVQMEGKFIDDPASAGGNEQIYDANFRFDLAEAVTRITAPTRIIEVVSPEEDREHGRQGAALAALMPRADTIAVPQIEATGIDMYVGITGSELTDAFLSGAQGPAR